MILLVGTSALLDDYHFTQTSDFYSKCPVLTLVISYWYKSTVYF